MQKTPFAGLTQLAPGESLSTDGFSFQNRNPTITDKLLELALISHRHDEHAALADPTLGPTVTTLATGGTISSGLVLRVGYTLLDALGGETVISPLIDQATAVGITTPDDEPTAVHDDAAGELLADTYLYAVTVTDGSGGETALGPAATVIIPAGSGTNQVTLSGLGAIVTASGGTGWRVWRMVGGGQWAMLEAGATDTLVDDGTLCADASLTPPTSTLSTQATSRLRVTVPGGQPAQAARFRIYVTDEADFGSPALLADLPAAQLGVMQEFTDFDPQDGAPPETSLAFGGATKINAETELAALYWRTPVADFAALPGAGNTPGDVRATLAPLDFYVWDGDSWERPMAGHIVTDEGVPLEGRTLLDFTGGGVTVTDDPGTGRTVVTVPGALGVSGHVIRDEGVDLEPRGRLDFIGAGVTVTDDELNDVTKVVVATGDNLTNAGTWNVAVAYTLNEVVHRNGSAYVALIDSTGVDPEGNPATWGLLVSKGADGTNGTDGTDGVDGAVGPTGPAPALTAGAVTTLAAGSLATADVTEAGPGTYELELGIPEGPQGVQGVPGPDVARSTVSWATAVLADSDDEATTKPIGKGVILYRVQTDVPARVQLYTTVAKRNADVGRAIGADPVGNHGLILDVVTTLTDLDWHLTPAVYGMNLEAVPDDQMAVRVTNLSGAASAVNVTLTRVEIDS